MIKMILLGNIGGDAVIKHFDNDRSVCNFSVAHTKKFTNRAGVKEETTTWVDCSWWGKPDFVNKIAPHLKKGQKVFVEGEPGVRAYIPTNGGDPRGTQTLNVEKMEFASGPVGEKPASAPDNSTAAANANSNPVPEYAPPADISSAAEDDDLPF